jgi:hypothetical protein
MARIINKSLREERACNIFEYWSRRIYSWIFYYKVYRKLYPNKPLYVPAANKEIMKIMKTRQLITLEWGAGYSTYWYARNVKSLITIEHDKKWYFKVKSSLKNNELKNVKLKYIHSEEEKKFKSYSKYILNFNDEYFDLVSIDGRDRLNCSKCANKKVKIGGYLVLDDSHRERYKKIFDLLVNYKYKKYDFGIMQTTIFQRIN